MNKKSLVSHIASQAGISNASAERSLKAALSGISEALQRGETTRLIGFGTFAPRKTKAREGRNPRTGRAVTIKAGVRASFTASKALKASINS